MPSIELTRHLYSFFPHLQGQHIAVQAGTVAEAVRELEKLAPGIEYYICDDLGRLRTHVNIFIGNDMIRDRKALSDPLGADDRLSILQALSGG